MLIHVIIILFVIAIAFLLLYLEYGSMVFSISAVSLWLIASVASMYVEMPISSGMIAINQVNLGYFFFMIGIVLLIVYVIIPIMSLQGVKK